MDEKRQDKILELARHLVTLATASLGFVITIMLTSLGDESLFRVTEYRLSLLSALALFIFSVVFGFLTEVSTISISYAKKQRHLLTKTEILFVLAWASFIGGVVALVIFASANVFSIPSLSK